MKRKIDLEKLLENGQIDKETIDKLKKISFKQEHFNSTSIFGTVASLVLAMYFYGELFGESGNIMYPIIFFFLGLITNIYASDRFRIFSNTLILVGTIGGLQQINYNSEETFWTSLAVSSMILIASFLTEKVSLTLIASLFLFSTFSGFLIWQRIVIFSILGITCFSIHKYIISRFQNIWMWFSRILTLYTNFMLLYASSYDYEEAQSELGSISPGYWSLAWAVISIGSMVYANIYLLANLLTISTIFLFINYSIQFWKGTFFFGNELTFSTALIIYGVSLLVFGIISREASRRMLSK
ncbi:hypothetical protein N9N03_01140 [Chlamydiia bacterium]|nr:hypothetical protein [Chlamydiia bacterium]